MSAGTTQVMMTLAALAATAPDERPSGETLAQQQQRIITGINLQLGNAGLATGGAWTAIWLGLTRDRANLAYIAQSNASPPEFALVLRGTQFNNLTDLAEDLEVGSLVEFAAAGPDAGPLLVSQGAMEAFTEVINAVYAATGTTLLQQLTSMVASASSNPTLYVTGHSLGGAMATMLALYLAAQDWSPNQPILAVYTFAAPTAGTQPFADCYDSTFPNNAWRIYNDWDLVPNAWASLSNVEEHFYPSPGPAANTVMKGLLKQAGASTKNNAYTQTNQNGTGVVVLNPDYASYDTSFICPTTADFLGQVAYQHSNDLYLSLLGAQPVPTLGPVVTGVAPNAAAPGQTVTITGKNFLPFPLSSPPTLVDFGTTAGPPTMVTNDTIHVKAPDIAGTVDVRVTTPLGTSPVTSSDQFTSPVPTQPPAITAISPYNPPQGGVASALSPNCGPVAGGTQVTITGTGFSSNCTVAFVGNGTTASATGVVVVSPTQITAYAPASPFPPPGTGTVDVQVTNSLGTSAATEADQFTYGPPVVTGVNPACGPAKSSGRSVTIRGAGFAAAGCSVMFGSKPATNVNVHDGGELTATPPDITIALGAYDVTVDVTVTNDGAPTSDTTPADRYVYYPG